MYYILWGDKTLLLDDVLRFSEKIQDNKDVDIKIMTIVEIAEELNFIELPVVSQLLRALAKKHGDQPFALFADGIDGEVLETDV